MSQLAKPFTRQFRTVDGIEKSVFGDGRSFINIKTDRLVLSLTRREAGVDFYSLRDVSVRGIGAPVKVRNPRR